MSCDYTSHPLNNIYIDNGVFSCRGIAPLVAVFQLLFGTQALAQGILRAIAKNWDIVG